MEPITLPTDDAGTTYDAAFTDGYHRNLLVVGVLPEAQRFAGTPAFHTLSTAAEEAPGLGLLSILEQTGMVRQVYPLGRTTASSELSMASAGAVGKLTAVATELEHRDPLAGVSIVELTSEQDVPTVLRAMAEDPNIDFAARVPVRYLVQDAFNGEFMAPQAVPPAGALMWNLAKIRWREARQKNGFTDADDIHVAVLDTGIDPQHPDLAANVDHYVHTYSHPLVPVYLSDQDKVGHGTHVAGTIAAGIDNGMGVHGICNARLHAYKIFNDYEDFLGWERGFGVVVNPVAYRLALRDCIDRRMHVVNLSIGGAGAPTPDEANLFRDLLAGGTVVVAAMGNARLQGSPVSYPAAIPGVIAVGATGPDDRLAWFSSAGQHIALCAPGIGIWSTLPTYPGVRGHQAVPGAGSNPIPGAAVHRDTHYGISQGTSMAAPHVAAASALIVANAGAASPAAVKNRLMETADRTSFMEPPGNPDYGAGRLDLQGVIT